MSDAVNKWVCGKCEDDSFNILRKGQELFILCYSCGQPIDMPEFYLQGLEFERTPKKNKKSPPLTIWLDTNNVLETGAKKWMVREVIIEPGEDFERE
jgi:hypothetical protein